MREEKTLNMEENKNAVVNKKRETVKTVRERERERELYSREIGFISGAKNKLNRNIKRIGYKKSEKAKLKIAYPFIT